MEQKEELPTGNVSASSPGIRISLLHFLLLSSPCYGGRELFLLLLRDTEFVTKRRQDSFHTDVETAQSRQAQSQCWQLHRVWRADKGNWSNSIHNSEIIGWGQEHFGSFWEPWIWGTELVMCFLPPACQLCLPIVLVYNINTKSFPKTLFEQTPPQYWGWPCWEQRGSTVVLTHDTVT